MKNLQMKMSRNDVTVDKKQVKCVNASWLAFSKGTLKDGMFFVYRDGDKNRFARMVYRIASDPLHVSRGNIVAQVAASNMLYTMERWIDPVDVLEIIPAERMNAGVVAFFDHAVAQQ